MRISKAYSRYIREFLEIKGTDENQLCHYRAGIRIFIETIGDVELSDLTLDEVARYKSSLKTYSHHRCENIGSTTRSSNT